MKPVGQTDFYPGGNCFSACLASLLEIECDDVPNFITLYDAQEFWYKVADWLHERGFRLLRVNAREGIPLSTIGLDGLHCIASGTSPRGDHGHSVIGQFQATYGGLSELVLVHDPHPSGSFLAIGETGGDYWDLAFLLPIAK